MNAKFFIYLLTTPIVIYSLDSININQIFKKNKINQARVFYLILALCIIYILSEFIYDFFLSSKFI